VRSLISKDHQEARQDELKDYLRERMKEGEQKNRERLKEFVAQLREPGEPYPVSPAKRTQPSFVIGPVTDFPHAVEAAPRSPERGHLSESAHDKTIEYLRRAAMNPSPAGRESATRQAAQTIAQDWGRAKGLSPEQVKASVLHEARAQATFAIRELAEKAGLNPAAAQVVGFSFERALEREGFKVIANHAIDKAGDLFKPSSSSVAVASGLRHSMETKLNQSMQWMADRGITREALKGMVEKHTGKFQAVALLASNPEVGQRAAQILSHSDSAAKGVMLLASDKEFRQALGGLTLAAGEAVGTLNKGLGSAAILTGAALKGESAEDMARHAFRAGMSVLGGALGAAMGAGIFSVGTAVAGASVGSMVADKVLDAYDRVRGNEASRDASPQIDKEALARDARTVGSRLGEQGSRAIEDRMTELTRERSYQYSRLVPPP